MGLKLAVGELLTHRATMAGSETSCVGLTADLYENLRKEKSNKLYLRKGHIGAPHLSAGSIIVSFRRRSHITELGIYLPFQ